MPISSRSIIILSFHLRLGLPKGRFYVGLTVKILKALLPSSILATFPAHLNLLDLITLTVLSERTTKGLQGRNRLLDGRTVENKGKLFLGYVIPRHILSGSLSLSVLSPCSLLFMEETPSSDGHTLGETLIL